MKKYYRIKGSRVITYIEFTDGWATRQLEFLDDKVRIGGVDTGMCDQPLKNFNWTADMEISKEKFEELWMKYSHKSELIVCSIDGGS